MLGCYGFVSSLFCMNSNAAAAAAAAELPELQI